MKKVIKSLIITFIMILTIAVIMPKSNAAGLTISLSKTTANVGENVTVTVNGNGIAGKIALSVSENATVSPSNVWVDNSSATATVKINGNGNIKVTATPVDASDSITANPFTTATAGTITVATASTNNSNKNNNSNSGSTSNASSTTQQQTKSNVATLANLGIKGQYDFTGFKASKTSYSVTVPNEAESVEIYATKGQSEQKITGTGVKQLKEGANAINVVVTAEDGKTTKTYTINIERKSSEETTENPEENVEETSTEEQESFGLKELKIEGIEITPEFKTDIYTYTAELKDDKNSLELTTVPTVENAEIEVTGNEDLKNGENIITVIVKEKDTDKTATYQITVNKISNEQNITDTTVNKIQLSKKKIIVICAGVVVLLLIVIILIIIIKKRKSVNNSEEYYYSELYSNDDKEENSQENIEEYSEEQQKKKKHSRGKRFK